MTGSPTARFYALNLVLFAGLFTAETLSETLFLSRFGVTSLPLGLIGAALIGLAATALFIRLVTRFSTSRLLIGLAGAAAGVALFLWGGLALDAFWAIPLFLLLFRPIRDLLTAQVWNYLAEQYDTQQAKHYLPLLGSASQIGAILAGLSLPLAVSAVGPAPLLLVWAASLLAVMGLAAGNPRRPGAGPPPTVRAAPAADESLRDMIGTPLRDQPLVRAMALTSLLLLIVVVGLTYQTSGTLVHAFPDERQLSSVYATVGAVGYAGAWGFQALLLPRLLRRLGVSRMNLFYPGLASLAGLWLGFLPGVPAAVAGQVTRAAGRQALQVPVDDLLLNALPPARKVRARGLLRGGVVPAGAVAGSLLVLGLQELGATRATIGLTTALFGLAALVGAYRVSRAYRAATLALVRDGSLMTRRLAVREFGAADPEVLRLLESRFAESQDDEEAVFLAGMLLELDDPRAEPVLVDKIGVAAIPLQVALLEFMVEHRLAGEDLQLLGPGLARAPDPRVRRLTLEALAHRPGLQVEPFADLLQDPDPYVRVAAVHLLSRAGGTRGVPAQAVLDGLLAHPDAGVRARALGLLASSAPFRLVAGLADAAPQVRQAAAETAVRVPDLLRVAGLLPALEAAVQDPAEAVRRAAVQAVARTGPRAIPILLGALGDTGAAVRLAASDALTSLGQASLPALRARLATAGSASNPVAHEAAITVLARLSPHGRLPELATFEDATLQAACTLALAQAALPRPAGPAGELLAGDLAGEQAGYLDRLYRLLAATAGAETAQAIRTGLGAPGRHRQAEALEAMESILSPEHARLMATLVMPTGPADLPALVPARWALHPPDAEEAWHLIAREGAPWRTELIRVAQTERQPRAGRLARARKEAAMLSTVEKAIFLRAVPSFSGMAAEQLRLLATASEELDVPAGATIIHEGDPGDRLFVIVAGRVGIEEQRAHGSVVRIATLNPKEPFGELAVFDAMPHTTGATAVDDCHLLAIRRDVLLDLCRRYPDLSFEIIKLLSQRLRAATTTIAEKSKARPRQLVKLFDQLSDEG